MKTNTRQTMNRSEAYSLMETLIAIAIFSVGFVGVASIFPAAAALQRSSAERATAENYAHTAQNMVEVLGSKLTYVPTNMSTPSDLLFYHPTDSDTSNTVKSFAYTPTSFLTTAALGDTTTHWPLSDRGYPTSNPIAETRDFFWVPLLRDRDGNANAPNWEYYVFILKRQAAYQGQARTYDAARVGTQTDWANFDDSVNVPVVKKFPGVVQIQVAPNNDVITLTNTTTFSLPLLQPGDWILEERGGIYKVISATSTQIKVNAKVPSDATPLTTNIWFAPPPDPRDATDKQPSPTQAILVVKPTVAP